MELPAADIEKILQAGQLAKIKLFQSLIKKIKDGHHLSASELKALGTLEKELEAHLGNDEPPTAIQSFEEAAKYCGFSKRSLSHHVGRGNVTWSRNSVGTWFPVRKSRQSGRAESLRLQPVSMFWWTACRRYSLENPIQRCES